MPKGERQAIADMAHSEGWGYLSTWIQSLIDNTGVGLIDANPRDPVDIALRQGRAQGMKSVLDYVKLRVKGIEREDE